MKKLVERNGYVEQVWRVQYEHKHFAQIILVEGTEPEIQEYMESEMGFVGKYRALTDREVEAANLLRLPIYLAPKKHTYGTFNK